MKVIHKKSQKNIANNIKIANTFQSRLLGVMFIKEMKDMDGLLLDPANSIHNCFVRFSLDVLFLDKNYKIVKIIRNFKPWRFSWIYLSSRRVLELPAGMLIQDVEIGDEVEVQGV